ncbi:MAG: hypothetical protein U0234_15475 [Sandaracinus sp.]
MSAGTSTHPEKGALAVAAALDASDPERVAIEQHVALCPDCAREWEKSARLAELLGGLAAPPAPDERKLARTRARVHAQLAVEPRVVPAARTRAPVLASAAGLLISSCVALGLLGPSISASRTVLALATLGVAALLPGLALRSNRHAVGATLGAFVLSLGVGMADYHEVALVPGHAVGCLVFELLVGALPLLVMLGFSRSRPEVGAVQMAAVGASGALAGQAVLLTQCAADESVLHVLFFHVAGVLLAGLYGAGLGGLSRALR